MLYKQQLHFSKPIYLHILIFLRQFKERVREMQGSSTAVVEGEDSNDWLVVDIGIYLFIYHFINNAIFIRF